MDTIGELCKKTGCPIETIRYYEKVGMLQSPPRTAGGHRLYGEAHLKRLQFVLRARELGFGLDEIRQLLSLSMDATKSCNDVYDIATQHLAVVNQKIHHLTSLQAALQRMAQQCQQCCPNGTASECTIIDAFNQPFLSARSI